VVSKTTHGQGRNIIIETSRFQLRLFTEENAALIYKLNIDPEVTCYTTNHLVDLGQAREIREETILTQYTKYNHGQWAVHTKNDIQFIISFGRITRPEKTK
jgi:RimJ/RimL family protein N-acetyltransferase